MMMDWMRGFKEASATPIDNVQQFPAYSAEIKGAFPKFQPPQRFAYLDTQPELWEISSAEAASHSAVDVCFMTRSSLHIVRSRKRFAGTHLILDVWNGQGFNDLQMLQNTL